MSSKSLVSVVIIFLNAERFIKEAIESVFAQTYDHWELLLVDDGSTDASTEIARNYVARYPKRVYYLEHPYHQNHGKSVTRNLGIRHARGEYIAFLDADDIWLPNKLEEQVAILNSQSEAGMVYGLDQYWYSWSGKPEDNQRDFIPRLGIQPDTLVRPPALLSLFLAGKAAVPCPTNILLRSVVAEKLGGFEDAFDLYDDQVFYAKVCLKTSVFITDACWSRYRQHLDSSYAVAEKSGQEYVARLFFLKWLSKHLTEQGVTDPEVWRALKRDIWLYRHYRYPIWLRLPGRAHFFVRWTKKWVLRLEQWILPASIGRWLWSQS